MDFARLAKKLDHVFKLPLAEPWDNVGLLIQPSAPTSVSRICLTNDLTEPVLNEVTHIGANFVISYHPPIFRPLRRFTQSTSKERIVVKCIEHKIAVYSPHTALDAVSGGLNDWLLSPFGTTHLITFTFKTCCVKFRSRVTSWWTGHPPLQQGIAESFRSIAFEIISLPSTVA